MPLPFTLGAGLYEPAAEDFARAMRRMLPDGYAQNEDSDFFVELETWGVFFKYLHEQRRRLLGNVSVRTTTELIAEWESCFGLADDAVREVLDRQARLVAAESARGGASSSRIATALGEIGLSGPVTLEPVTEQEISDNGLVASSPNLIFQLITRITDADYLDRATRSAVVTMLTRMLPARSLGQDGASVEESLSSSTAVWSGTGSILGRTRIPTDTAGDPAVWPTRVRDYGPGSVIRKRDLDAIQDAFLRKPTHGGTVAFTNVLAGQESIVFAVSVVGTFAEIDSSIDWRKRMGRVVVRFAQKSTTDIRPGHAHDVDFGTTGTTFTRQVYWGTGSTFGGSPYYRTQLDTNLTLYVDSTTGVLCAENHTGVDYVIVGMCEVSAPYDDTTGTGLGDRLIALQDGQSLAISTALVNAALYDKMKARGLQRVANGADVEAWSSREGDGTRSVVAYVVNLGSSQAYALDDGFDWRDRLVHATCIAISPNLWSGLDNISAGPVGASRHSGDDVSYETPDRLFAPQGVYPPDPSVSSTVLGYTGVGQNVVTSSGATINLTSTLRLVATTTGALILARDSESTGMETYLLLIEASARTGKRSSPTAWTTLTVADNTDIAPWQLNGLQDRSLLGVCTASAVDVYGSQPLGPQLRQSAHDAETHVPELLKHHGITTAQQRDAVGWARRYFATSIANNAFVTLDSSIDWRDRLVRASVRWSSFYDHLPGHTDDRSVDATQYGTVARYTGTGGHATAGGGLDRGYHLVIVADSGSEDTGLCLHADATTGALTLRNKTGSTMRVTGFVDGSFRLGLRDVD